MKRCDTILAVIMRHCRAAHITYLQFYMPGTQLPKNPFNSIPALGDVRSTEQRAHREHIMKRRTILFHSCYSGVIYRYRYEHMVSVRNRTDFRASTANRRISSHAFDFIQWPIRRIDGSSSTRPRNDNLEQLFGHDTSFQLDYHYS